jgi:hypothetical protein
MRKLLIIASLALLLSACGSDDDVIVDPIEPVDPAPTSVTLDQANSIDLTIDSVDAQNYTIAFTLADADKLAITDASSSFEVRSLGMPNKIGSSFSIPWHNATRFGCDSQEPDCVNILVEVSPGAYTLTPSEKPAFDKDTQILKISVTVVGALAQSKPEIITPAMGENNLNHQPQY